MRSFSLFLAGSAILAAGAATALFLRSLVGDTVAVAQRGRSDRDHRVGRYRRRYRLSSSGLGGAGTGRPWFYVWF